MAKKVTKKKTTKKSTRKKPSTRKRTPKPKQEPKFEPSEAQIKKAVENWIIFGDSEAEIIDELGGDDKAQAIFDAARDRVLSVAKFDRQSEIGAGLSRLRRICSKAIMSGELNIAVSAQTQINKLLGLFPSPGAGDGGADGKDDPDNRDELQAIADHLRPLGLGPDKYPLSGIARIAADRIRQLEAKEPPR